jgi:aminoglycoside 3-N-acetyltransferase
MSDGHADERNAQPLTQPMLERAIVASGNEAQAISQTVEPLTQPMLERQLRVLGLDAGLSVLVHCSLRRLGWVCGGAQTVVSALVNVITPQGTILMPAFSSWNTDPAAWQNPPVPKQWHQTIRDNMPPYIAQISPSRGMGSVAELFRGLPGVRRSPHPIVSFTAWGRRAAEYVSEHPLDCMFGEESPLARLYQDDGLVLSLGLRHNSALHLSEYRANWPGRHNRQHSCAMLENGARRWVEFEDLDHDDSDFERLKLEFERDTLHTKIGKAGIADCRLVRARAIVDYAAGWMERNRGKAED